MLIYILLKIWTSNLLSKILDIFSKKEAVKD
jgi:hypothetical protein